MNPENEKIKKNYEKFLIGAEEAAVTTIDQFLRAVNLLDRWNDFLNFKKYNVDIILNFKEKIRDHKWKDKCVSPRTARTYILHIQKFFRWLGIQSGYKSTEILNLIAYLKPNKIEDSLSSTSQITDVPDINYVLDLCSSIKITCDADLRDRALIAFLLLTGIRISAVISLPFGCIDKDTLIIDQNPAENIKTKFGKYIISIVFPFDETLVNYIKTYLELLNSLGFKSEKPLFSKNKIEYDSSKNLLVNPGKLSGEFWRSTTGVAQMIKRRSKQAGLKYYSPHKFRHGTAHILYNLKLNACDAKVISQALGHESVSTTFAHYGNYSSIELKTKLTSLKFDKSNNNDSQIAKDLKEIKNLLKKFAKDDN